MATLKFSTPEENKARILNQKLVELRDAADEFVDAYINLKYPNFEKQTFDLQVEEAKAYRADSSFVTLNLNILCSHRFGGFYSIQQKEAVVDAILQKSAAFTELAMTIAGQRQYFESQLKSMDTLEDIETFTFNYSYGE